MCGQCWCCSCLCLLFLCLAGYQGRLDLCRGGLGRWGEFRFGHIHALLQPAKLGCLSMTLQHDPALPRSLPQRTTYVSWPKSRAWAGPVRDWAIAKNRSPHSSSALLCQPHVSVLQYFATQKLITK